MDLIVLFRLAERLTLTAVVLVVSLVVMVGFWRSVQKFDVRNAASPGVAGSFVFSTPVFVLLAIIAYAWVSLEHPITVGPRAEVPSNAVDEALAAKVSSPAGFVGSVNLVGVEADDGHGLALAIQRIKSLNCIAEGKDLSNRDRDNLDRVKLGQLWPYWQPEWGDPDAFASWATGRSGAAANPDAQSVWDGRHSLC